MFDRKIFLSLTVVLFSAQVFAGNFAQEFQKADYLMKQHKFEEARDACLALLEVQQRKRREVKKDELHHALAICSFKLKDPEKANEYMEKIQDEYLKKYCQLNILYMQKKNKKIMDILKGEDLTKWPDRFIYTAAIQRGENLISTDPRAAEKDLTLALKYTVDRRQEGKAYMTLGELYESCYKDKGKAIEYYEKAAADNRCTKKMERLLKKRIAVLKGKKASKE